MANLIKNFMKHLARSNKLLFAVVVFWSVFSILPLSHAQESDELFLNIEKLRDAEILPIPNDRDIKRRKDGILVTHHQGKPIYLWQIFQAASIIRVNSPKDALIVYGYLWDKDMHIRCVAFIIISKYLELESVMPPLGALRKVGAEEFQNLVGEISNALLFKIKS
jgi:hypothetical protein